MKKLIKQPSTMVLRAAIVIIGALVLAIYALAIPQAIGPFDNGGYDPLLLGLYLPAVPFFIALLEGLKLLSFIDSNRAFTADAVGALKNIKHCALAIAALFTAGMPYIFYVADKDDAPGVVAIGVIIAFLSFVIGMFAAVMHKLFQSAVMIKSENDLTV